jgi:hypothetical protein
MKQFKVRASYISICETVIEAESKEQALAMAYELDGGEFDSRLGGEDWQIDCVQEVTA